MKPSPLDGVHLVDTPTIRLEGKTINAKTTANEPALIAIMTIGQNTPFLAVSSAFSDINLTLEPHVIKELHAALDKLLEVTP